MKDSLIGKSLKLGAHIRMGLSFISIPLVVDMRHSGEAAALAIDFYFGIVAADLNSLVWDLYPSLDHGNYSAQLGWAYTATMTEGVLISLSLAMISFAILLVKNAAHRKKITADLNPPQNL